MIRYRRLAVLMLAGPVMVLATTSCMGQAAESAPAPTAPAGPSIPLPEIQGDWWKVAGDPDLGPLTDPRQQPVDFAIWQAADGTWQLWSCIRNTKCGGNTRLFYRWEGRRLTDPDWKPMGIAMQADPAVGESPGGLQAPHVFKWQGRYYMLYGCWTHISLATSEDGKTFTRRLGPDGKSTLFDQPGMTMPRDPMTIRVGDLWHCYYTAHDAAKTQGAVYLRTSADLVTWSPPRVVAAGGEAGSGPWSAECPFVYLHPSAGYYLFRTQRYGRNARTTVYCSRDPRDFGVNDDRFNVAVMPVAAPEIIEHEGRLFIAALEPDLKGIRIARFAWTARPGPGAESK